MPALRAEGKELAFEEFSAFLIVVAARLRTVASVKELINGLGERRQGAESSTTYVRPSRNSVVSIASVGPDPWRSFGIRELE